MRVTFTEKIAVLGLIFLLEKIWHFGQNSSFPLSAQIYLVYILFLAVHNSLRINETFPTLKTGQFYELPVLEEIRKNNNS